MRDWLNCRSPPPSTTNLALDETKQPPACPSRWWTIASPSVSRSCRAMQRAAAGKADRAVGSVDGPTLLLAEVRSDLGKFDKWPVLCLPVRIVDGGEMSSHRGLEIEVSAPRTGPESRIRRHRSIVPFMWWYHFHFPISCAISCLCHIFPPGIDECHNCTGGSSGSPAPLSDQCCFRPSSPPLSRCNVPRKCQARMQNEMKWQR